MCCRRPCSSVSLGVVMGFGWPPTRLGACYGWLSVETLCLMQQTRVLHKALHCVFCDCMNPAGNRLAELYLCLLNAAPSDHCCWQLEQGWLLLAGSCMTACFRRLKREGVVVRRNQATGYLDWLLVLGASGMSSCMLASQVQHHQSTCLLLVVSGLCMYLGVCLCAGADVGFSPFSGWD